MDEIILIVSQTCVQFCRLFECHALSSSFSNVGFECEREWKWYSMSFIWHSEFQNMEREKSHLENENIYFEIKKVFKA